MDNDEEWDDYRNYQRRQKSNIHTYTPVPKKVNKKVYKKREERHPLESSWSFWYSKKQSETDPDFESTLVKMGTFDDIEGFWRYYAHIKRPNTLVRGSSILMFRGEAPPMWENYRDGGIWALRVRKKSFLLPRVWEELLFACIGEAFEEPDIVGVSVCVRKNQDSLKVWHATADLQYSIQEKIKKILHLPVNTPMEYLLNRSSITTNENKDLN